MVSYKTPGVYIEEINTFPPGVAAVETAIPAFIGYVAKAEKNGEPLIKDDGGQTIITPLKIKSLIDFEFYFGKDATPATANVHLEAGSDNISKVEVSPKYYMYNALRHFFDNGGGECFIVPIGLFQSTPVFDDQHFLTGLEAIKKFDDPTLLVAPDAVNLDTPKLGSLQFQMLKQCGETQDRFAILDVKHDSSKKRLDTAEIETFRQAVGARFLDYGAAYFPYLRTTYSYSFSFAQIQLKDSTGTNVAFTDKITSTDLVKELSKSALEDLAESGDLKSFIHKPYDYEDSGNNKVMPSPFEGTEDIFKTGITNGYALIAPSGDVAELSRRTSYVMGLVDFMATLGSEIQDTDAAASKAISSDAKSAKEIYDSLVAAGTSPNFSPIESTVRDLIAINLGHPDPADLNATDPLNIAELANSTTDHNPTGVTYDTTLADVAVAATAIYGSGTTYDERVRSARTKLQTLYDGMLDIILDFLEEQERRAESLEELLIEMNPFYSRVVQAVRGATIILPPSGAIAGLYASVDNTRGVWKAPANESLGSVIGPTVVIDNNDQKSMNVDPTSGKSVNAIRAFRGKGTLVWGGRTLKGNDDNWRYISVRRLFIFMEESVEKAMENFVFEPNTANTWIKVQTTIENFLTTIWRQGGLAGAKPEDAFRVSVGLGKTMSADDVNKGLMIIDVMVAPSRPAEFIVLRFSQMQQVS